MSETAKTTLAFSTLVIAALSLVFAVGPIARKNLPKKFAAHFNRN